MKRSKNTEKAAARSAKAARFRRSRCYSILFDKGVLYFLISFAAPMLIMLIAFADANIHPLGWDSDGGDRQILVVDLWHQYYPFFRVVREKLLTGGSFLYSWENGLGTNFLSLISYYAASPLNWLSVFFSEDHVREAMTFILAAKIGFAGAFFSCFLRYTYRRRDFSICVFSTMFALCSYVLGYYWNVMWFDTVALFPLVMMGIVALCREGKWKTYTLALALSLAANYYIGYFTCIFSIFMFASAAIIESKSIKGFFRRLWLMIRSSVISIGLGGFMLLPAYYGLKLTYSAQNSFPQTVTFYEKWTDIFANMLSYSEPAKVEGLPNFACGMLAVLLFGVFIFSFGIKIREKIAVLISLAAIAVSCNMNVLNYIWHGFHFTNQIPYRFAFIFSFVLVAAAYRAYSVILYKGIKGYQLVLMLIAPTAVFVLKYISDGHKLKFGEPVRSSLIITAAFFLVFVAAKVFPFKRRKVRNTVMTFALAAAVASECLSNAQLGVQTVGTTSYTDYPLKYQAVETLLSDMKKNDTSPFYRTEMTETYTLNDSALYGYYGMSQFSSAANVSVTRLSKRLGLYASDAGNRFYYRTATPVVNQLLGIKYLIKRSGTLNSEDWVLENINTSDGAGLYLNRYALSLGFMMNDDVLEIDNKSTINPFEYQNEIIRRAVGTDESLFVPQPVALVDYSGLDVTKNGYGNYTFRVNDESGDKSATYHYACLDGSYLYGYAESMGSGCDELMIRCNTLTIDSGKLIESYPITFPMGNGQGGSECTVKISAKDDVKSGNYKLMIYALNTQLFEQIYSQLSAGQLEIESFSDTKIEGSVNAVQDGLLYLSIPYEKGWSVYVDGEKAETEKVLDAMLGVKVSKGRHEIKLKYTPEGFPLGVAASSVSLVLFAVFALMDKMKKKHRRAAAETAEALPAADPYPAPPHTQPIYNQAYEDKLNGLAQPVQPEQENVLYTEETDEKSQGNSGVQGD